MDILIITNFTSTFSKTDNDRFLYIAKELAKAHEVEIITSDFCHEKKCHRIKPEAEWNFKITFLHETGYSRNICLKRFYSHFIWGNNVKRYLKKRKKPDVIYCAIPSLSGPLNAAIFCKKNNIRFIIDIQDLWPEAFQLVFNVPVISSVIFYPFKRIADKIYSCANEIIAVSQTYVNRAIKVNKKCQYGHTIFLGTELEIFDTNASQYRPFKKKNGEIWLAYCGTLGASYDIPCVIDALKILKDSGKDAPEFIIIGDGDKKKQFETYAMNKGINVTFIGRVPYDKMCAILVEADIVVNPIAKRSAGSIINKHADYAACGLPVLNTQESLEYRRLVDEYQMGFNCQNGEAKELANAILKLVEDPELRNRMGNNARKCAGEKFDRKYSYKDIYEIIEGRK